MQLEEKKSAGSVGFKLRNIFYNRPLVSIKFKYVLN